MITSNYKKCLKAFMCKQSISFLNIMCASGSVQSNFYITEQGYAPFNLSSVSLLTKENASLYGCGNTHYLGFGTGETEPTEDDYKLEGFIASGFQMITTSSTNGLVCTSTVTEEEGTLKNIFEFSGIFKNISGQAQTIKEFGIYYTLANGSSGYGSPILLYRQVFDEPIVVEADNTFTFGFSGETTISFG